MVYQRYQLAGFLLSFYLFVAVLSFTKKTIILEKDILTERTQLLSSVVSLLSVKEHKENTENSTKLRIKRQSGENQYMKASKMPQMKLLRLFLQLFKNLWDPAHVGGHHPLHVDVPKPVSSMYREKIYKFFFPDIEEKQRQEATA